MKKKLEDQKELVAFYLDATARELGSFEKKLVEYSPKFRKEIKKIYNECREVIKKYQKEYPIKGL